MDLGAVGSVLLGQGLESVGLFWTVGCKLDPSFWHLGVGPGESLLVCSLGSLLIARSKADGE